MNIAIFEGVDRIAKVMDIATIAGTVESADDLSTLGTMGIDHAQGCWINRPQPRQLKESQRKRRHRLASRTASRTL